MNPLGMTLFTVSLLFLISMAFWLLVSRDIWKRHVPSKFLNLYDFGMKMYTSQTITARVFLEEEL